MTDRDGFQEAIARAEAARVDLDLLPGQEQMVLEAMGLLAAVDLAWRGREAADD